MKRLLIVQLLIFIASATTIMAQTTYIRVQTPENTPEQADIFIAGSFNNWEPGDTAYKLTRLQNQLYYINIDIIGNQDFKFTRGDWGKVETTENGQPIANRQFQFGTTDSLFLVVEGWEDIATGGGNVTLPANVTILDEQFYMASLDRHRRIWVYLPPDYETTTKKYPVMYMQDGQNLFDRSTAFAGEWGVDESLNSLFEEGFEVPIVIGIDNGSDKRIDEYCPWENSQYGGGEGLQYINFIKDQLKPYIDSNFRTASTAEHATIMGSSLGALIAHFAGLSFPETFGNFGLFSPAFWINPEIFDSALYDNLNQSQRFYFMAGDKESARMVEDMERVFGLLLSQGIADENVFMKVVKNGEHNEFLWRTQFKEAVKWLYKMDSDSTDASDLPEMYPVPAINQLFFRKVNQNFPEKIEIISISGQLIMQVEGQQRKQLDITQLQKGMYIVRLGYADQQLIRRLIIQD